MSTPWRVQSEEKNVMTPCCTSMIIYTNGCTESTRAWEGYFAHYAPISYVSLASPTRQDCLLWPFLSSVRWSSSRGSQSPWLENTLYLQRPAWRMKKYQSWKNLYLHYARSKNAILWCKWQYVTYTSMDKHTLRPNLEHDLLVATGPNLGTTWHGTRSSTCNWWNNVMHNRWCKIMTPTLCGSTSLLPSGYLAWICAKNRRGSARNTEVRRCNFSRDPCKQTSSSSTPRVWHTC